MKSIVFLYAGFEQTHAFDSIFSSQSAFERTLTWTRGVEGSLGIVVAVSEKTDGMVRSSLKSQGIEAKIIKREVWLTRDLLEQMALSVSQSGADCAVYSFADRPFLDSVLTKSLLKDHFEYAAEYTFADGYPEGFAPEVIDKGTLNILASLAKEKDKVGLSPVKTGSIFSVIKTDINSFEIETVIAEKDWRMLRLDFSCSTKEKTLACRNLYEEALDKKIPFTARALSEHSESSVKVQRTVPAFYSVQISGFYGVESVYNPLFAENGNSALLSAKGKNPPAMPLEKFRALCADIASYSETAVVSLSAWGDPLCISSLADYVDSVLQYPGLSVLIECDGLFVDRATVDLVSSVVKKHPVRENPNPPVTWIVSVDAFSEAAYNLLHPAFTGEGGIVKSAANQSAYAYAVNAVALLEEFFPGDVYPQFMRMNKNENELESFYRYWHDSSSPSKGRVIIQKYDNFCGKLSDEKPADLSPLTRPPCWHLKRDLTILADGSVPMCRECVFSNLQGNVFNEGIASVWKKMEEKAASHIAGKYADLCGECDEYYTFNF